MTTYTEHLPASGLRDKTVKMTLKSIADFEAWRDGRDLSASLLTDWRDHLGRKHLSPRTKNTELARVKAALNWMRKREQHGLDASAIGDVLTAFPVDREAPRVLSRDEIAKLANACKGSETGRTVLALLVTGMRHEELMTLTPANLIEQGIEVRAANSKNRQGRVIPWFLIGNARPLFQPLPFVYDKHHWDKIRERSGVDVPLKAMRSTAATYLAFWGKLPLIAVAKVMGHTMDVLERNYLGAAMFDLKGDSMPEIMGVTV